MAFWAADVSPNKETVNPPLPFDLHLSLIVLGANAQDKGRTVVQAKIGDKNVVIGALKLDLHENLSLDLIIDAGQSVTFSVIGKNPVQIVGYYVDNHDHGDDFSDDDEMGGFGGIGGGDDEISSGEDSDDLGEDGDEDSDEDEEIDEEELNGATIKGLAQKRKAEQPVNGTKKPKVEQQQGEKKPQQQHAEAKDQPTKQQGEKQQTNEKPQTPQQPKVEKQQQKTPQQPKGEQQKTPQQPKGEQQQKTPQQPKGEQQQQKTPQQPKGEQQKTPQQSKGEQQQKTPQQPKGEQQKTPQQPKGEQQKTPQQPKGEQRPQTPGQQQQGEKQEVNEGITRVVKGVRVETKTIGLGTVARPGNKVWVQYIGRLENGKVFDKSVKPLDFILGAGDVIAGWDIGVNGMRVGEKRKLTIPPQLAYGASGAPPSIPRNATLVFDVELVRV